MLLYFYILVTYGVAACYIFIEPRHPAAGTKAALCCVTRSSVLLPSTCCGMSRARTVAALALVTGQSTLLYW